LSLSKTVQDAMNEQMKQEFYAAYLYLSMSAHCSATNFPGFAKWLRIQAREEVGHAMRIYDYLDDRGGRVVLQAVPQPATEFASILSLFEQARDHERKVTGMINRLYELVDQEKDYASHPFLEWFLTEQIEEEKQSTQIVESLRLAGDHPGAMLMLDREMGARGPEEKDAH
jgi:ferritin